MVGSKRLSAHRAGRRDVISTVIQAVAAGSAALVFQVGLLGPIRNIGQTNLFLPNDVTLMDLLPVALAVIIAALAALPTLAGVRRLLGGRLGWQLAAVGALMGLAAVLASSRLDASTVHGVVTVTLAVAAAVTVSGALLACAEATGADRTAISIGLIGGMVVAQLAVAVLSAKIGWLSLPLGDGASILFAAPAALILAAVVNQLRDPDADPHTSTPTRFWRAIGPAVLLAVTGVIMVAAELVRERGVRFLLGDYTQSVTQRRLDTAELVNRYGPIALSVTMCLVLVWYAYQRGGFDHVQWVLTAFALATALPLGLQLDLLAKRSTGILLVIAGIGAAAAGVLLTRLTSRLAPWNAVGVVLVAGGLMLSRRQFRTDLHSAGTVQSGLLVVGLGLALGASLTVLLGAATMERASQTPSELVGSLALGLGALLLGSTTLAADTLDHLYYVRESSIIGGGPALMLLIAAALAVIFAFRRVVRQIRTSVLAEARRAAPAAASDDGGPAQTTTTPA